MIYSPNLYTFLFARHERRLIGVQSIRESLTLTERLLDSEWQPPSAYLEETFTALYLAKYGKLRIVNRYDITRRTV